MCQEICKSCEVVKRKKKKTLLQKKKVEMGASKRTLPWEVLWEIKNGVKKTSCDPLFLFSVAEKQKGAGGNQTAATLKGDGKQTQNKRVCNSAGVFVEFNLPQTLGECLRNDFHVIRSSGS